MQIRNLDAGIFLVSADVGGQAVPGGVALRHGDVMAVAVRTPDDRVISTTWHIPTAGPLARIPLVRGVAALVLAMTAGIRAMAWGRRNSRPTGRRRSRTLERGPVILGTAATVAAMVTAPLLFESFFAGLPHVMARFASSWSQLVVFVLGLVALARFPWVRTLLANHGAEHKVVAAYEVGGGVSVASAQQASRFHARCGTSFAALLVLAGSVAYPGAAALGWTGPVAGIAVTLVLVGATFEVQRRAAARLDSSRMASALLAPGLWLQRITTVDPTAAQIEVAIEALQRALAPIPGRASPGAALPIGVRSSECPSPVAL